MRESPTVTLADDDRARIPFALISVLLLVTSVGLVAVLESRPEPTVDRTAEDAVDRTTTAAVAELRGAILAASHRAGAQPINTTAGSEIETIATADDREEAFRHYVALLVYLEASERLPAAGGRVGTDVETTVSLPPVVADPEEGEIGPDEAIDRVDLRVGRHDADLEPGTIAATIEGVELDVAVGGELLPTETLSVGASVGSPVFELDERASAYERRLDADFFEDGAPDPTDVDGLGQELAVRLYPLAYLTAGWNRFGDRTYRPDDHAFEEVIDTDHAEVLVNHAVFSVQEETFGAHDPYAERTMRPKRLCTGIDVATTVSGVDLEVGMDDVVPGENVSFTDDVAEAVEDFNRSDPGNVTVPVDGRLDVEEEICADGGLVDDWVFGAEATGELPELPPLSELIAEGVESMAVADAEIEVPVTTVAEAAYVEYHVERAETGVDRLEREARELEETLGEESPGAVDDAVPDGADEPGEYDRSPADVVDELYAIDVTTDTSASADSLPTPESAGEEYVRDPGRDSARVVAVTVDSVDHSPHPDGDGYGSREIHTVTAEATVDVRVSHGWEARNATRTSPNRTITSTTDGVDVTAEATVYGEYGFEAGGEYYARADPDAEDGFPVAANPIETDYGSHDEVTFETGFENALVAVTTAGNYDDAEAGISDALAAELSGSDPSAIERSARRGLIAESSVHLDAEAVIPDERAELLEALSAELETVHGEFTDDWEDEPLTVELAELTDEESPPGKAIEDVQERFEEEYVDDGGVYETPEAKARAQIRKAYFDRLYYWLDLFDEEYDEGLAELEDELDAIGEDAGFDRLDDALGFVQGVANADLEPEPAALEGSPVHDDAHYEVSGSPTYLTGVSIDRELEPAIRPPDSTVLEPADVDHDPLAVRTDGRIAWPGLPVVLAAPSKWYATVNSWSVEVRGEYARFEVSSTIDADGDRLTYVAEDAPVAVELADGESVRVGHNEAIDFETRTEVLVVMPGAVVARGGPVPAVADGEHGDTSYCTETWREVGPDAGSIDGECER